MPPLPAVSPTVPGMDRPPVQSPHPSDWRTGRRPLQNQPQASQTSGTAVRQDEPSSLGGARLASHSGSCWGPSAKARMLGEAVSQTLSEPPDPARPIAKLFWTLQAHSQQTAQPFRVCVDASRAMRCPRCSLSEQLRRPAVLWALCPRQGAGMDLTWSLPSRVLVWEEGCADDSGGLQRVLCTLWTRW